MMHSFGPFRLEADERRLWRDGSLVALAGKAFDTLRLLVEGAGRLQTQASLMDRLWPDVAVEANNLQYNISLVRRALAGAPGVEIETVRGQGYRLLAEVQPPRSEPSAAPEAGLANLGAPIDAAACARLLGILQEAAIAEGDWTSAFILVVVPAGASVGASASHSKH